MKTIKEERVFVEGGIRLACWLAGSGAVRMAAVAAAAGGVDVALRLRSLWVLGNERDGVQWGN